MNRKEIMEIKKRLKKDACTFTRMCGCYVNSEHSQVTRFTKTFLNLDEEEFFKYLELAKQSSGTGISSFRRSARRETAVYARAS